MKKKTIFLIVSVVIIVIIIFTILLNATGKLTNFRTFFEVYRTYLSSDVEHQVILFETILGGICAGTVTFLSLFITILHENKKDRLFWERERRKDKQERLLSVRPLLNLESKAVSVIRNGNETGAKDFVNIGKGQYHQYATIKMSNNGYGKCKRITLDGRACSISQLDIEEIKELNIYFFGLDNDGAAETNFQMVFGYQNIFGNSYLQIFECYLKGKELEIEIGEPLLKEGEE